ncbi:MAG: class I SAM-dependent methyltransferase [Betaproteobacteria bacterium]|nr:class I SAM-dependent methyltransferase [Betaproteobacteria bacterium]
MSDWTAGYVADISYTYGYYRELNPLALRLAFLNHGLFPPEAMTACELGYGQGLSANLHAAGSVTEWYGTDFNPTQAAFAKSLGEASGARIHLFDESFADFAHRADLPDFDYIGLHGIWSWVSDENRTTLVDFIRRKLKVGGVLYLSYNTLPGWASAVPLRHLLTEHAEVMAAPGRGIVHRIDAALEFAEKLFALNPRYATANPQVVERLKAMKDQNRHYMAHEYFNRDWHPMHFATLAEWLEPAKLTYGCSAHYLDHVSDLNFSAEQKAFLSDIPDPRFRESVRDFIVNQPFRRDYWVKGPRRIDALEQTEALRRLPILLTIPRADVSLKVKSGQAEANLAESINNPILDVLADQQPHTLGQIEAKVKGVTFAQLVQAATILVGLDQVQAAQDDQVIARARPHTDRLNTYLIGKARGNSDVTCLASPVTGGGIAVSRFEQLFLLARRQGLQTPGEWAAFAGQILRSQGQKILKEGKSLETPEALRVELEGQAKMFGEKRLPVLEALQIS